MVEPETGASVADSTKDASQLRAWAAILRGANPTFHEILTASATLEEAREAAYAYVEQLERATFTRSDQRHPLEQAVVRACVRTMRCLLARANEELVGASTLDCLWKLARGRAGELAQPLTRAFVEDARHLLLGLESRSHIYGGRVRTADAAPEFVSKSGREAAEARSAALDELGEQMRRGLERFPSGLGPEVALRREENRRRILGVLGGTDEDWLDYRWHLAHVVTDGETLSRLVEVPPAALEALRGAARHRLPVGITPYYVSLMDERAGGSFDAAVRAQVLPPPDYVTAMSQAKADGLSSLDFMGEHDTSPVDLITRRYPGICILKPYNTCSQICVYCQRNWEIDGCLAQDAAASDEQVDAAVDWIAAHDTIGEVLVTGGDPVVMEDAAIERILARLSAIDHLYRIRVGTRTPVVLPFRWTEALADLLARFHEPGRREVAVVTHFEHSAEVTPEARDAVARIRRRGMGVYNQQVFTAYNSRRFEAAKLRLDLRRIGVDPYYCFNMKGKEETNRYRVPLARILQERKEEARLLPGLDRTDEPVFNVPLLGKNHLRALQDRNLVMLMPDGSRAYEFHPWEKYIEAVPTYVHYDVPIQDYLDRLDARGEDLGEYATIWYYF